MPDKIKINWSMNVQVVEGPKFSISETTTVEAYDKIEVFVKYNEEKKNVQIQPGDISQIKFLLISSSLYGPNLTYSVNADESEAKKRIKLDVLQLFIGEGSMGLFGKAPKQLFFYNKLGKDKDVSITILVGRKVT